MLTLAVLFFSLATMFQRASVIQMDLTDCVTPQHSVLAALAGAPDIPQRDACAEYVLASPTVVFRIQAKKSETLMVPGEIVSFRAGKGKLYVRRDDNQGELESTVLCMRAVNAPGDACGMISDPLTGETKKTVRARIQ